jgi:hypothetical protein
LRWRTSADTLWPRPEGSAQRRRHSGTIVEIAMPGTTPLDSLHSAYHDFVAGVLSVPEARFLASMNGWSPRDVVAHLIGWNRLMIQSGISILAGEPPAYYADAANDFRSINAAFVAAYSLPTKADALRRLDLTMGEFEAYIAGLSAAQLFSDRGIRHHSGQPATVAKLIGSLAGDYALHARQIREWVAAQ